MCCIRLLTFVLLPLISSAILAQDPPKGFLGIELKDITREEAEVLGWEGPRGIKVVKPTDAGPAANAGILPGDVILSIDGVEVENMQRFVATIGDRGVGSQVRLRVLRSGKEHTLIVTLGQRPPELAQPAAVNKDLPLLMLDTGGHRALIRSLAFTRTDGGKHLVSAGDDKVIRVWDWREGNTVRTLHGQVGPGPEGKIYAMALSPNDRWLAVGGYTDTASASTPCCGDIRLYEFGSGELRALLKAHADVVESLAFSPDSQQLISGGGDSMAVIWDVETGRPLRLLSGHMHDIYAVGFTPDGERAVTGSYDTALRLWRVKDGALIARLKGHQGKVQSIAISPANGEIASGDWNGEIRLWDGQTGSSLRTLASQGNVVGLLRFSPDGTRLLSGAGEGADKSVHVWDTATGAEKVRYTEHDNVVIAADISPDGRWAATGGGNTFPIHIWNLATGERATSGTNGRPLLLEGTGQRPWAAGFSADGRRIGWGNTWTRESPFNRGPIEFQLTLPLADQTTLGRPEPATDGASFVRSREHCDTWHLSHKPGGTYGDQAAVLVIAKDGTPPVEIVRDARNGIRHSSYTFTPDGTVVISGGANGHLTAYSLDGKVLANFIGHESVVWAVTPSPDGRLLISASADQTVRLWQLAALKDADAGPKKQIDPLVSLFHGRDGEWVMWTPQGYYTGSPGADKIVGWQINKGPENAAEYVSADQLRDHLNRPDIVQRAIILASAEAALREAPGTTFKLADLLARPVPRFRIVASAAEAIQRGGRATIRIAIEPTRDPVRAIRVQVNGRQVEDETPDIDSGGFAGERALDVPLARGRNEVRITLTNAIGEKTEVLALNHDGEGALDKRGTLYILAIGVDKYPRLGNTCGVLGDKSCDLAVSGADARSLVAAVEERLGPAHDKIVKRLLINGVGGKDDPTAANILDAIDTLKQAEETDTVVLFIAGHGFNDGPDYRFLATNAEWTDGVLRGSTVVQWQVLQAAVEGAKGRRILFIDTCHSGNAYNQRLGNAAYHANIIAYTAARFDQTAKEDDKLGHGLFTFAVIEGLEGKGGIAERRQISTKQLADYVIKRVEELAKAQQAEQEPQYFKGRDAEDYVLARW
jgi:WD40 repeat protein